MSVKKGIWCLVLLAACVLLPAQETATPALSPQPSPTALNQPNSFITGTWKVERAIFEYFGNLKEVTGVDEKFFTEIRINAGGAGKALYGTKTELVDMEWDLKDGQNLTLAFGSRLRPQVDLYRLLMLGDGTIFLRSTRLANATGTIVYLMRKTQ